MNDILNYVSNQLLIYIIKLNEICIHGCLQFQPTQAIYDPLRSNLKRKKMERLSSLSASNR